MGIGIRFGRAGGLAMLMAASVAIGGLPASGAGATAEAEPPQGSSGPADLFGRAAGTWGACGSWWTETPTRSESGSVCGVDGLVTDNGQATQLAEPLIQVSRYVCLKRKQRLDCSSESFSGTVRRSEMTVDPFLRRATIRGALGGCALDVEFAGLAPPSRRAMCGKAMACPEPRPRSVSAAITPSPPRPAGGAACAARRSLP